MFLREITLRNLLSFGPETSPFALRNLNVLIGPNGSGKSNFIEAIGLLQAAPTDITKPIQRGGGIDEWLWKGLSEKVKASITIELNEPESLSPFSIWHHCEIQDLGHVIPHFAGQVEAISISDEWVDIPASEGDRRERIFDRKKEQSSPPSSSAGSHGIVLDQNQSILSQAYLFGRGYEEEFMLKQAPTALLLLLEFYKRIRIYRDWSFGRSCPLRLPQQSDEKGDFLAEDYLNLGLVLNRLKRNLPVKRELLELLGDLYPGITDFGIDVLGGRVQLYLEEERFPVPATRLSDGTLRYLCLLAILCHPKPPPLICIEEPELGLHPDVLVNLAKLIKKASERTQLIITTHSEILVDALTYSPEDVVVCEKGDSGTVMRRLDRDDLEVWLEDYTLGQLWSRGQIGGNRW